jgi:hypothetical protein
MKYYELLCEHVLNLFSPEDKAKYADAVWDILQKSYKNIGGFKGASSPDELINTSSMWKLVRKNNKIVTAFIYKDKHGRKLIGSGTDRSAEGIAGWHQLKNDDAKLSRAWGEVSGRAEQILAANPNSKAIPNQYAEKLLGKKILDLNPDGFHYTRLIDGSPKEKIIYGTLQLDPETYKELSTNGVEFNKLPSGLTRKVN